ncbi:MAG: hypothetical protein M3Q82_10330 [Actinomycetota bacterium]|nr:hypothetical protein [Actinomycetota bacterium]
MTDEERRAMVAEAERWFEQHGLPYFVAGNERRVLATLRRTRLAPVIVVALVVGLAAGVGTGLLTTDVSTGVLVGAVAVAGLVFVYALVSLHLQPIVRWAVRQTFGSLGWLFPLITRALPLLLLFMTFLFINTEVWQVSSALDRGLLWLSVLLFATVAVAFLLVRLPEEVRRVSDEADDDGLVRICRGTPVEAAAVEFTEEAAVRLSPLQRANLVLVLLFSQALQVLLLAVSVFCFFLVFGKVAVSDSVIQSWVGDRPKPLPSLDWLPISNELFQVSVFLAAFSGLYFTVYAVTDENYRNQFFTSISEELERAVGVQAVYRALTRRP